MSTPEPHEGRTDARDPERPREDGPLVRLLGDLPAETSTALLVALAFFPPSLALVGAATGYELGGSLLLALVGLGLGAATGLVWARDFVRWRVSPPNLLLTLALLALFAKAYLSTGAG